MLKESQLLALSPVPEAAASHNSSRDISSVGATPVQKKKRKLYKQTPQLSEVRKLNAVYRLGSVLVRLGRITYLLPFRSAKG